MARRVVQFSTGNVGRHSLQAIIGRPDLELVGVHTASANRIGRDAAELCGVRSVSGSFVTDTEGYGSTDTTPPTAPASSSDSLDTSRPRTPVPPSGRLSLLGLSHVGRNRPTDRLTPTEASKPKGVETKSA